MMYLIKNAISRLEGAMTYLPLLYIVESIEEVIKAPTVLRERKQRTSKAQASAKLDKIMEDIDAMLERSDSEKETGEGDNSASDSDTNIVEDDDDNEFSE